jgi:hypothetical protein
MHPADPAAVAVVMMMMMTPLSNPLALLPCVIASG